MAQSKRIYQRTTAGLRAARRKDPRLAGTYRTVLLLIDDVTHADDIEKSLGERPYVELSRCLEELEGVGWIESISVEWLQDLYSLGCYEPQALS